MIIGAYLAISGCGKRPRSLIPVDSTISQIHTFDLPHPQRLTGRHGRDGFVLLWHPIKDARLQGYALYKFESNRFLRHKPYATLDNSTHTFIDQTPLKKHSIPCYALRPWYKINGKSAYGALSNVVCFAKH